MRDVSNVNILKQLQLQLQLQLIRHTTISTMQNKGLLPSDKPVDQFFVDEHSAIPASLLS